MPDTERTEAELLQIFESQKVGGITAQDVRDFVVSAHVDDVQNWVQNGVSNVYRVALNTSTTQIITHNLGQKYVGVFVYDADDKQILPDEVTLTNSNSLIVDVTSYGSITGNIVVIG